MRSGCIVPGRNLPLGKAGYQKPKSGPPFSEGLTVGDEVAVHEKNGMAGDIGSSRDYIRRVEGSRSLP